MKIVKVFPRSFIFLVITSILLCSCGSQPSYNPPTLTAQALRARDMATQIAIELQGTEELEQHKAQATAQANKASLEANENWPITLSDSFDQDLEIWPTGKDDDPLAEISREIVDGKYRWQALANDAFVWWVYPDMGSVSDLFLSAQTQQISGPANGEWGLVYRVTPDDEYYLFEINAKQEYSVFLHQGGVWETLVFWKTSDAIQADQENKLAVIAQGTQFLFFINDQFITQLTDDRLAEGKTGVLIGLSNEGDQGIWEFDDFSLSSPDLQEPSPTITP